MSWAPMGEAVDALSAIVAGPVLEAVLHACPHSSFAAVRGACLQTRLVADQLNHQRSPRWPLRLLIRWDNFVRRHEEIPPEFILQFDVGRCRAFASSMGSKGKREKFVEDLEEVHLPRELVEEFIRKLGSMHRTFGETCKLWTFPKLRRRATMREDMTVQEYQWCSMQVAMQCDPRASREMLLQDALGEVVLRHVFLDQDCFLPHPAIRTGATRTRHPVLDTFGDVSHRWFLRQLRKLRDAQRGSPAILDDSYNACSLGIIDPALISTAEDEDDDIFSNRCKARSELHGRRTIWRDRIYR